MSTDSAALPQPAGGDSPAWRAGAPRRSRALWARAETIVYPTATMVLFLVIWEYAIDLFHVPNYVIPKPSAILKMTIDQYPYLLRHTIPTLQEILAGFGLSIVVGVPLAVAIVGSRIFEKSVYPILVTSQTVPKVAIAPLLVVWFGFGQQPKILIAFLIAFFPVVIDTAVGLRSVPVDMIDLARSMGASPIALFWKIRFPYALPNIFAGLKVAITLAVIGAVVGEFIGANQGLGYVLVVANGRLDTTLLFAAILVLVLIGIVTFLVVDILERITIPWHVSVRKEEAAVAGTA